jgi:hypothetical protein
MAGRLSRPHQIHCLLFTDFLIGCDVVQTRIYHCVEFFNVKIHDHTPSFSEVRIIFLPWGVNRVKTVEYNSASNHFLTVVISRVAAPLRLGPPSIEPALVNLGIRCCHAFMNATQYTRGCFAANLLYPGGSIELFLQSAQLCSVRSRTRLTARDYFESTTVKRKGATGFR